MAVFRWGTALEAFRDLEREMDRLLRSVHGSLDGIRVGRQFPPLCLYQTADAFLLHAEVPGVAGEDVELAVANGVISLTVSRGRKGEVAEERYRRSERPMGKWVRSITLPERVLEENVVAELRDGLLLVRIPKAPSATPRQIPVAKREEAPGT
jgi:HSP20 family protein